MPLIYAEGSDPAQWGLTGCRVIGPESLWPNADLYREDVSAFNVSLKRLMCRAKVLQQVEEMGALTLAPDGPCVVVMGSFDSDQLHFQMSERAGILNDDELNILEAYAAWLKEFVCPIPHAYVLSDKSEFPDVLDVCRRRAYQNEDTSVLILQDGAPINDQVSTFVRIVTDPSVLRPVRCGVPVPTSKTRLGGIPIGPAPLHPPPAPP